MYYILLSDPMVICKHDLMNSLYSENVHFLICNENLGVSDCSTNKKADFKIKFSLRSKYQPNYVLPVKEKLRIFLRRILQQDSFFKIIKFLYFRHLLYRVAHNILFLAFNILPPM